MTNDIGQNNEPTLALAKLWQVCPRWHVENLLGTRHSPLSQHPLFLCPTCVTTLLTLCVHTHSSDCVQTVYELQLLPNNTAVKHFYTNQSGAKCWLDIYRWGAGLAVTGPMRDIGQNVLQSALKQEVTAAQLLPHFVTYRIARGSLN
jgi:hypothetical protein